jgi:4-hydroxy-2-oxoheptanedioate aldolase
VPPLNRLRALWQEGKPAFGALVTMPSVQVVQVLAHAGFDWLLIDLEHGPIDLASTHALIVATAGTPAVPLVRVAWNLPWLAKPALDSGALGICFPLVRSRADAEAAVRAVRYPPAGERLWGPFHAPIRWDLSMREYLDRADEEVLAIATVEDVEAVRRIDEIVAVPGLHVAVIGPGDLATSLGYRGRVDHPEVQAAMAEAEAAILRSGVVLGGVAHSPDQANRMVERGYRLLALGFDWSLLQRGAAGVLDDIRR